MMNKEKLVQELYESTLKHGLIKTMYDTFGSQTRMNLGFSKKSCDVAIEEFSFSVRGYNVLKRNNIHTLGDLIDVLNTKKLIDLRNLGKKTAHEIKTRIVDYGYSALDEKSKKAFLAETILLNSM